MSGVCAATLLSLGAWSALRLPFTGWSGPLVTAALLLAGVLFLIRSLSARQEVHCTTCRGAGTVYSAEYNDWRRKGPVQNIRELCPACQGVPVGTPV